MQVPGIEQTVEQVRVTPGARHGAGATEDEVADTERTLGLDLPAGYRTFLLRLGWLVVGDLEVLGAGAGVPAGLDVVAATHTGWASGLPPNAVLVARDPSTTAFCLDAAHVGPYESPVYRWEPGATGGPLGYVAHDFASWLWMRLADAGP